MQKLDLCGQWRLTRPARYACTGTVPGSVYSFLLASGQMQDPYYRENELRALTLMEQDFTFQKTFSAPTALLHCPQILLHCAGLDTICTLTLNGQMVGRAYNMHRTWEFDVTSALRPGENTLEIQFASPTRWIADAYRRDPHQRQPPCHARLSASCAKRTACLDGIGGHVFQDAGIWREICLLGIDSSRITDVHLRQRHENGHVWLYAVAAQPFK